MKIVLFGAFGMLGKYIYSVLSKDHDIIIFGKHNFDITKEIYKLENILDNIDYDLIINCSSSIPQKNINNCFKDYIIVNTLFPIKLDDIVTKNKKKLIHITTDSVFSGTKGNYNELDTHDDLTIYGVTKSLGEISNSTIIRTSIIGEDLYCKKSFLEWLIQNKNKTIDGYANHKWNGVTCLTLSNIIKEIIDLNLYWKGVRHIFSPEIISKYELCCIINKIYNLNITINLTNSNFLDRSLSSIYDNEFKIDSIYKQIEEQKNFSIKYGKYEILNNCRFCQKKLKDEIIKFNDFPLSGSFLKTKENSLYERIFPLTFIYCENCKTGLIKEVVKQDNLFTNINNNGYFYYSSTISSLVEHFKLLSIKIKNKYLDKRKLLEIGCNDGVFLNNFIDSDYKLIGIDPSQTIKNITSNKIIKINDFFNDDTASYILEKYGKQDIIVCSNCLAHINDINNIYKNIKILLENDGIVIIEVHYLKEIIDNMNFDFIYHEHMSYYSISTFIQICKNHNFFLENIDFIKNHGGSLRVFLRHKNLEKNYHDNNLDKYIVEEEMFKTNLNNMYVKLNNWKTNISSIIETFIKKDIPIIGYGASGRTNMIINFLEIKFDLILDDSQYKIGSLMPLNHIYIENSNIIYNHNFPYIFILAWPFYKSIIKKHINYIQKGGQFIIILPEIVFVDNKNYLNYVL